jgi:hypothetical protein
VTGPTFGDKASGLKPGKEYRGPIWERQIAESRKHLRPHGPFICRLCGAMGGEVWISVRNIAGDEPGAGFRSLPCCADRDACRERREMQGKVWPLIDASMPSPWAVLPEKDEEEQQPVRTFQCIPYGLLPEEQRRTIAHAKAVDAFARENNLHHKHGEQGHESQLDDLCRGFGAELAAAAVTGLELCPWILLPPGYRRQDKTPDIGRRTDVKSVARQSDLLAPRFDDAEYGRFNWYFLKVSGRFPSYCVEGWVQGHEVMDEAHKDPTGWERYLVENWELHPLPLPPDA